MRKYQRSFCITVQYLLPGDLVVPPHSMGTSNCFVIANEKLTEISTCVNSYIGINHPPTFERKITFLNSKGVEIKHYYNHEIEKICARIS